MKNVDELGLEPRMVEAKRLKDGSVELFMTYTHPEADGREWAKRQGLDPSILKSANAHLDRWSLHVHLPEDKFPSEAYVDLDRLALEDLGFASFLAESFEGLSEGDVEDRNIGRGQFDEDSRHRIPPRWIIDQVQRFQASERSSSPSRVRPGARATTF